MSGHSKFANIKHKKEKNDAAKGKVFTIIGREIAVAVKEGGPDPANNSKLRDVIAKAKANAVQILPEMIEIASNGVFEHNRKAKHARDAKMGWYRYDTRFALPVYNDHGEVDRYNIFTGRLLIRHASSGKKYLYDVLEIKKETSKSCQA